MENIDTILKQKKEKEQALTASINGYQLQLEALLVKIEETEKELTGKTEQLNIVTTTIDSVVKQTEVELETLQEARKGNSEEHDKMVALKKKISELCFVIPKLEEENSAKFQELESELNKTRDEIENTIISNQSKIDTLNKQINELNNVRLETIRLCEIEAQTQKELTDKTVALKKEILNSESVLVNLNASIDSLNKEIERLIGIEKEASQGVQEMYKQKLEIEDEINSLTEQKVKAEAEVKALITDKINFVERSKALLQKEENIKLIYKEAGVQYPE